jgi:hypothetical protein
VPLPLVLVHRSALLQWFESKERRLGVAMEAHLPSGLNPPPPPSFLLPALDPLPPDSMTTATPAFACGGTFRRSIGNSCIDGGGSCCVTGGASTVARRASCWRSIVYGAAGCPHCSSYSEHCLCSYGSWFIHKRDPCCAEIVMVHT